jgi:hypothetical protein
MACEYERVLPVRLMSRFKFRGRLASSELADESDDTSRSNQHIGHHGINANGRRWRDESHGFAGSKNVEVARAH